MFDADDARKMLVGCDVLDAVEANMFDDVDRFSMDTGDILGGDADNGELGKGGDALLLRDIGGLDDHSLVEFSLEQAGILRIPAFSALSSSLCSYEL